MAEASSSNQDLFTCAICLDFLKDPVTLNCGHNYCMGCIKGCWDQEDQKGVYSCPQCRQTFTPRPVLSRNNVLDELVEQFRKTGIQATADCYAGPGDVECDSCSGRKHKAVKSCLVCLLSYCKTHLQRHDELFVGKRHNIVDATGHLQENICPQHQKLQEIFCRLDKKCVCMFCLVDEHKGHDTVTVSTEKQEKQGQLQGTHRRLQDKIREREEELKELQKAVEILKHSAETAVKENEEAFATMIRSIEKRRSEVIELIRAQEKAAVSRAEGVLNQLEQEITELKRRDAELEQLSHTKDDIHFVKTFHLASDAPHSEDLCNIHVNKALSFGAVANSVYTVHWQLEESWRDELFMQISQIVSEVEAVFPEPVSVEEIFQYYHHFTLDPNTAHENLYLSDGNRRVEKMVEPQSYPDHPDRFDWESDQVLCREGISGRCFWEIEYSGVVAVAVSYKSIPRKGMGPHIRFGCNEQSWKLDLYRNNPSFYHRFVETKPRRRCSHRIGIYVDHKAGTLAFYNIFGKTVTLLHRVQTAFTEPLYPGFTLNRGSSLKLVECLQL